MDALTAEFADIDPTEEQTATEDGYAVADGALDTQDGPSLSCRYGRCYTSRGVWHECSTCREDRDEWEGLKATDEAMHPDYPEPPPYALPLTHRCQCNRPVLEAGELCRECEVEL